MKKTVKLLIGIILGIIILSITPSAIAAADNFRPDSGYPISQSGYEYYCKQKGGGLRTFDEIQNALDEKSKEITVFLGDGTFTTNFDYLKNYMLQNIIPNVIQDVKWKIQSLQASDLAEAASSGWVADYNGNFGNPSGDSYVEVVDDSIGNSSESYVGWIYRIYGKAIATKPVYTNSYTKTEINTRTAYILTAGANWVPSTLNQSNYQQTLSDSADIQQRQYALWQDKPEYNEGNTYNSNNGKALYQEAIDYENFYNNYVKTGNYQKNISIGLATNSPKVVVNKQTGNFIVGPYVITYPDDARFSFIENMYVKDQNGNRINVRAITADGSTYPKNNQPFFIEFSYATNPTRITLYANFAYINQAYAQFERLTGKGYIYRYEGGVWLSVTKTTQWDAKEDNVKGKAYADLTPVEQSYLRSMAMEGLIDKDYGTKKWIVTRTSGNNAEYKTEKKLVPIEDSNGNPQTYEAQYSAKIKAIVKRSGMPYAIPQDNPTRYRTWEQVELTSVPLTINMQIGGKVFVDEPAGKESAVDGIYKPGTLDKVMPGMTVHLFSRNQNREIASTKTDSNGQYVFTGLNVLDTYYVKFDYNGQYYEPTYYTTPSTSGDYKNTSNGTDFITTTSVGSISTLGRQNLNARFSTINSSPANYSGMAGYNKTYTRKQLEGYTLDSSGKYVLTTTPVIDQFGNLILNSSTDPELQKKIQYVKDCQMSSWTRNLSNGIDAYPSSSIFVVSQNVDRFGNVISSSIKASGGNTSNYTNTLAMANANTDDKSQYINQGYKLRQEVDVSIKDDVDHVTLEINGKTQQYDYNTRENASNEEGTWEIGVRLSDGYYNTLYSREIYGSDYQYKVSSYGNYSMYGKTKDDELKVYVTYKLRVRNQSMSIRAKIDEIVNYFDQDYEYVADRSYIEIKRGNNKGQYDVKASTTSRYASIAGTTTTIPEYQSIYIKGLDGIYLDGGQYADVYLTFVVEKSTINGENWIKLDEDVQTANPVGVGKENIVEINGYSTLYKSGTEIPNVGKTGDNTVAGLVDVDSNPGNLNPSDVPKDKTINYQNFEDDTDKAPNIKLVLYRGNPNDGGDGRVLSGYVWEDARNKTIQAQATTTGNGIRENGEKLINGVTVELVEVMDNGTEFIWRKYEDGTGTASRTSPIINTSNIVKDYEFSGDIRGTYAFKSFIPGNYIVRFKYGDTVKTVLPTSSEVTNLLGQAGLNDTSYNGQDYKSTIYQVDLNTYNKVNTSKGYNYDTLKGDTALVSDAKDLYNLREQVINYSNGKVTNEFAEKLNSYNSIPKYNNASYSKQVMQAYLDEFIQRTAMTAESGIISMEIEYNRNTTGGNSLNNGTTYHLANLDLGLEQRPKAQIEVNKDIKNLKLTLADGTVLFDASQSVENLLWKPNTFHSSYADGLMEPSKFGTMDNVRLKREFGLVQATMDQELMHGATIKIEYEITVRNIGETDYKEQQFYYTGVAENTNANIVKTIPHQLVDYVPNNLQYYEVDNSNYWKIITSEELINNKLINSNLKSNLEEFNTIITTTSIDEALVPTIYKQNVNSSSIDSTSVPLVLTQLITAENQTDDLTYTNMVELVSSTNQIGRKMEYSVVGNQDPTKDPEELDSDKGEVIVLPPFGATLTYVIIAVVTLAGATIIALGIVFIKKKVIKK